MNRPCLLSLSLLTLALALAACGDEATQGDIPQAYADAGAPAGAQGNQAPAWSNAAPDGSPSGANGGSGSPPGNDWQRVAIIDPSGFDKPMPALLLDIPVGWQTRGGMVWDNSRGCVVSPRTEWVATSPDGRQAVEVMPGEVWAQDNYGMPNIPRACPNWPINNVRDYLASVAQRKRPGSRVLDYRERPDLITMPAPPSDGTTRYWKEAGEVLVAYPGPQGEIRENISVTVQFQHTRMMGVGPNDIRESMTAQSGSAVAVRAPAGQLDLAMNARVGRSFRPHPDWQARMNKHNGVLAGQGMEGQKARGEIISRTGAEIAEINQRGYESRGTTEEAMRRSNVDSINNVTRYRDPTTGEEVQLDNRYDHGYRAQDGSYFQTDNPNLNPYVDLGIEAEQMEPIE